MGENFCSCHAHEHGEQDCDKRLFVHNRLFLVIIVMLEYTEKGAKVPDPIAPRRIDSRNAAMISSRVRFLYATDTILLIFLLIQGANIGNISETCKLLD